MLHHKSFQVDPSKVRKRSETRQTKTRVLRVDAKSPQRAHFLKRNSARGRTPMVPSPKALCDTLRPLRDRSPQLDTLAMDLSSRTVRTFSAAAHSAFQLFLCFSREVRPVPTCRSCARAFAFLNTQKEVASSSSSTMKLPLTRGSDPNLETLPPTVDEVLQKQSRAPPSYL